jgi:hypothetical protein
MREATFTDLRNHAKSYFDLVEAGETVSCCATANPLPNPSHLDSSSLLQARSPSQEISIGFAWCQALQDVTMRDLTPFSRFSGSRWRAL